MKAYKVYEEVNCADTIRDSDEYIYTQHGIYSSLEKAMNVAKKNMGSGRWSHDFPNKIDESRYETTCFRSYGPTMIIEVLEIIE